MLQAQKKNDWNNKNVWTETRSPRHDTSSDEDSSSDSENKWPEVIQFSDDESSDYDGDCEDNNTTTANNDSSTSYDKCPICLVSEIGAENRAYASGCFHKFCFKCLLEWSKVRATCPLCSRRFKRIVYACHSSADFKEWYVKQQSSSSADQELSLLTPPGSPDSGYNSTTRRQRQVELPEAPLSKASWIVGKQCAPVVFRALVYANEWYVDPTMAQQTTEEDDGTRVVDYTSQVFACQERFRAKLSSPQWYRDNEPLLMSWLARELCALALVANSSVLGGNCTLQLDQTLLTELLDKLVQLLLLQLLDRLVYDDEELSVVKSVATLLHLPERVSRHFVHELAFFLAAPSHDLVEYDARAVYFERAKAMNRKRYLTPLMLPLDLSKYRLVPAAEDQKQDQPHERMPTRFGVDMARNFVAAGLDKEDYVKRILMLHVQDEDQEMQVAASPAAPKRSHEEIRSTDSVASTSSSSSECESNMTESFELLSDDDDVFVVASWPPAPPPPSPALPLQQQQQQQREQLRGPSHQFKRTTKRKRRFASSE